MTALNQLATRLRLNAASMEHGEATDCVINTFAVMAERKGANA